MKRLWISNSFLVWSFIVIVPIYPAFGAVLYDGSRRGALGDEIDTSSIIVSEDYQGRPEEFISADIPLDNGHDWPTRDVIVNYEVLPGDTLADLARDFKVTTNTLRWVNNLQSNVLRIGQKLIIPPGDGILYTTKKGDTLDAIALKYKISSDGIRQSNKLGNVLGIGETLFLPGAQPIVAPVEPVGVVSGTYVLKEVTSDKQNRFVPGHCTYFVAKYWPVKWRGNARNWFKNASAAGFKTGQVAKPGSIVVWYGPGYNLTYGHVGIVMSVNTKDGTMVIKDMNYAGLWKITTRVEKLKNKYILGYIYNEKK